ncbi:MAG: hypothetical protein KGJ44_10140 [Betaproteobacteria bacterium]|nr:hypothetical protein [Betaproteobacteria bacterium]
MSGHPNFSRTAAWLLAAALLLLAAPWAAAQTVLESVKLQHIDAQQAAARLQPMLTDGEALIPARGELLLNVLPEHLAQYRQVLAAIDVAPLQWLVEVRQGDADTMQASDFAASGDVMVASRGKAGVVIVGEASAGQGSRILSQSVHVLDGASASISLGNAAPLRLLQGGAAPGTAVQDSTVMIEAQSGLRVTPHGTAGAQAVQLDLAPRLARLAADGSAQAAAHTSMQVPPGQWVTVARSTAAAKRGSARGASNVVQVRVTPVAQ